MRSANAEKTHCPYGHPYDAENTYLVGRTRHCRACKAARQDAVRLKRQRAGTYSNVRGCGELRDISAEAIERRYQARLAELKALRQASA